MDVRARLAREPVVDRLSDVLQTPQLRHEGIGWVRKRVDDVVGFGVGDGGMVGEQPDERGRVARSRPQSSHARAAQRPHRLGVGETVDVAEIACRGRPPQLDQDLSSDGFAAVDLLDPQSVVCTRLGRRLRSRQDQPRQYRHHGCEAPHVPSPTTRRARRRLRVITELRAELPEFVANLAYRRGLPGSAEAWCESGARGGRLGILPLHVSRAWAPQAREDLMTADASVSDLGRYRLGRLLGRGGMGEVYLAHDQTLDRDVAIKFVAADKVGDEAASRRLLHEAHAAAVLDHPCICTVYETGRTPEGQAFIVMQYVEGQTLSAMLQTGPLPVRDALTIAANIAEALSDAHRRGIIHRDLKPSNVIVTASGRPKLLDFGIAKQVVLPAAAVNAPTESGDFTTAGTIIGTPAYMSPEQIQQRPLDGRSDLFSLGVLLSECLTGRRSFEGPSTLETIANVLYLHPPAPSSLRRELTDRHDELCRRLMAKERSDRFQSADEVVGAIKLLIPDTSRTVVPSDARSLRLPGPGVRVSRRNLIAAAVVAIVVIAGFTIWRRPAALPPVPPDADVWYQRGLQAMRDGTYETGRRRLEQAIALFPQHVLAYTRLAEACAELDDDRSAQEQLLRVSELVPDESRLPEIERLRVQALRASVLRRMDQAVELHRQLVQREANSGAWLDLGSAQESAGLRKDARDSYAKAAELDPQSAAAHMRLGSAEALEARMPEALAALAEAERLYRGASNVEGETEVLLRREIALENAGDLQAARADLERAITLANGSRSTFQQVRARLAMSRVAAIQGQFGEAERGASAAVQEALEARLDTVAAEGLVDLAFTLQQLDRAADAESLVRRALQLADDRGARRIAARGRLQLASLHEDQGRPAEALTLIGSALPFLRENSYRLLELDGLQIAVRAHQALDQLETAKQEATEVLGLATTVKDEILDCLGVNQPRERVDSPRAIS